MKHELAGVAHLENVGIAPKPLELFVQPLQLALIAQRLSQEVSKQSQEAARLARVLGNQPRDGVERVEQEVRLEVRAEVSQLGLNPELLRFECANPRILEREGKHKHETKESVVGQTHNETDPKRAKRADLRMQRL